MKAEHRKELETNLLADKLGRMMTNTHVGRPNRRAVIWTVIVLVAVAVAFVAWRLHIGAQQENMVSWMMLENGRPEALQSLAGIRQAEQEGRTTLRLTQSETDPSNAGKAARFQLARFFLWDQGVRMLGVDSNRALQSIKFADDLYRTLLKDCENEPVFLAEAKYGLAVIEETRAVQNQERLATAEKLFDELATTHKESGFADLAAKRAKQLKENRQEITAIYRDLQTKLHIPDEKSDAALPKLPLPNP